jgi:hypothetical protein
LAAEWLADVRWWPILRGPLRAAASLPEPYATVGAIALGGIAGLVLAYLAAADELTVTVTHDKVALRRGGGTREVSRADIAVAFVEDKRLVLLGGSGEELTREKCELPARRLGEAFAAHGVPWRPDGDPHRDAYRRWVEGVPELPPGADPLFRARDRALGKGDKDDAEQLRAELGRLGVVVRDEGKRQFWRLIS